MQLSWTVDACHACKGAMGIGNGACESTSLMFRQDPRRLRDCDAQRLSVGEVESALPMHYKTDMKSKSAFQRPLDLLSTSISCHLGRCAAVRTFGEKFSGL